MINKDMHKYKKRLLPTLFIILFCLSCSTNSEEGDDSKFEGAFNLVSFENEEAYSIKENQELIFVGTEKGLFAKQRSEDSWVGLINEDVSIRAFEMISENEIIASLYFNNQDSITIGRTINFGETWLPYRNGFDPIYNSIPTIIEQSENDENTVYAGGSILRVAESEDNAKNWDIVLGSWDGFGSIFFIESTSDNLWAGGSSAIFEPLLYRLGDADTTWKEISIIENIEAIARDLIVINNYVFSGLSGSVPEANIIRRSQDNGETWNTVFEGAGIHTFVKSSQNSDIVYASGINQNGTLFFTVTDNFGDTWETIEFEEGPTQIRVNDMISVLENGKEVLYFGTNKGLYSYTLKN